MKYLLLGLSGAAAAAWGWDNIPYTRPPTDSRLPQVSRSTTILTSAVNIRWRPRERLYGVDVWREHR